ncbi:hypothetical protein GJ744_005006 [Endocarpon pusillum]|uniref:Uncharacterized protein n=1 Tax=Endocarpon pusillum TaxID=364733 RepID=A0A8H7A932_9EURO|nr:hypothetical protein GJ744_005006 [Endocarpon pusillum]
MAFLAPTPQKQQVRDERDRCISGNTFGDGAQIHQGDVVYNYLGVDNEALNDQCLKELRSTDPRDDKTRIELSKDDLLKESYMWILEDPAFIGWRDNDDI